MVILGVWNGYGVICVKGYEGICQGVWGDRV